MPSPSRGGRSREGAHICAPYVIIYGAYRRVVGINSPESPTLETDLPCLHARTHARTHACTDMYGGSGSVCRSSAFQFVLFLSCIPSSERFFAYDALRISLSSATWRDRVAICYIFRRNLNVRV